MAQAIHSSNKRSETAGSRRSSRDFEPAPSNLLEVRHFLQTARGLRYRERTDLISAINTVGRLLAGKAAREDGRHLADISTDLPELDHRLRELPNLATALKPNSLGNTISRARKGLRVSGVNIVNGHGRAPLNDKWKKVCSAVKLENLERHVVTSFASWCSQQGIAPKNVRSETFEDYKLSFDQLRDRKRNVKAARQLHLLLLDTWNNKFSRLPSVQNKRFNVLRNYDRYVFADSEWSSSFRKEIEAWEQHTQFSDLYDPNTPRRVGGVTAKNEVQLIKAMASAFCRSKDIRPNQLKGFYEFVTPNGVDAIASYLLGRARQRKSNIKLRRTDNSYAAARLIVKLGRYWVGKAGSGPGLKSSTLKKLEDQAWRLGPTEPTADRKNSKRSLTAPKKKGLSAKNRAVLLRLLEPEFRMQFAKLPYRRFSDFPMDKRPTRSEAVALSTAYALGLLMAAPVHPRLLATSRLDENINDRIVDGARRVTVYWPKAATWHGNAFVYDLTGADLALFDRYCSQIHPVLADNANKHFLFPGRGARSKVSSWLSKQLTQLCADSLGIRITAFQIRLVLAAIMLMDDQSEKAQQRARRFLGHTTKQASKVLVEEVKNLLAGSKFDGVASKARDGRNKVPKSRSNKVRHYD